MKFDELEQRIDEGLYDRFSARVGQAKGALQGLGKRAVAAGQTVVGSAAKGLGNVANKVAGQAANTGRVHDYGKQKVQQAAQNVKQAATLSEKGKYESYLKSIVDSVLNDLNKLKMPVKDEATLRHELRNLLISQMSNVGKGGQLKVGGKYSTTKIEKAKPQAAPVAPAAKPAAPTPPPLPKP